MEEAVGKQKKSENKDSNDAIRSDGVSKKGENNNMVESEWDLR